MSEPKVLHEWTDEDLTHWAIVEGERGALELTGGKDCWWTIEERDYAGPYIRLLAAEILRLRERLNAAPVGEVMTADELVELIENTETRSDTGDWNDDFYIDRYVNINQLREVLLRRKEHP